MLKSFGGTPSTMAARRYGTPLTRSGATVFDTTTIQNILHQLAQALTVLSSATDLFLNENTSDSDAQRIMIWLTPNARLAEEALHQLREYEFFRQEVGMELTQCLTVLILAADMIVQGHLTLGASQEAFILVRRNAERAMRSLQELRAVVREYPLA
jgi:hypothetical protein